MRSPYGSFAEALRVRHRERASSAARRVVGAGNVLSRGSDGPYPTKLSDPPRNNRRDRAYRGVFEDAADEGRMIEAAWSNLGPSTCASTSGSQTPIAWSKNAQGASI
jgi:hypothetical protein